MQRDDSLIETDNQLPAFISRYRTHLFFGFSTILFVSMLVLALTQYNRQDTKVLGSDTKVDTSMEASLKQNANQILVDVAGAVKSPGVYHVSSHSRVEQAIVVAGGFNEETVDKEFVAKELNLAAKLQDGQKIYVLHKGENRASIPKQSLSTTISQTSGKVSLNTASATELESLPGIGVVTAQKIINARPFQSVEELIAKKAVSNSTYTKIKDLVVL